MPQKTQIVPKFQHPHVETYVNDYTQYTDEVAQAVDNNTKFICVFRSASGIDNVLVKKNNLADFIKTYGTSNYEKYGQPLMMPIGILSGGNATVHCMRVMPDDAFAANSILVLKYKTDEETGKFQIKFESSYVDIESSPMYSKDPTSYATQNAFKKSLMKSAYALDSEGAKDDNDFISVPIATFRMNGRGVYGNEYRWRIVPNVTYEKDYGIKMYTFEIINTNGGIEKVASYVGSIVTSPKYSQSLTFINDIVDKEDMGDVIMDVQVLEDNVEKVYNAFVEFVSGLKTDLRTTDTATGDYNDIPDIDQFDPFFGAAVGDVETAVPHIQIISEPMADDTEINLDADEDTISISRPQGVSLCGGSDGSFDPNTVAWDTGKLDAAGNAEAPARGQQGVALATDDCYIKAFNGTYDKTILSTRRTPSDALFDANYSYEVKDALAELANYRESTLLYLDGGTTVNNANIKDVIKKMEVYNTRNISKSVQHYTTKDPTTQKRCEVTVTYFIAQNLANHFHGRGSWIPFVKSSARLSGHIKNSLEPCVDDIDSELKELLYTNRINYFECLEENVYERATQVTAQMANSDLIEENNMYTLYAIKTRLEADCWNSLYDFTSAEERKDFSDIEKAKFSGWEGSRLDTLDISFAANEWELERSIVHCYVSVQFRTLMKRAIIEIDVNKRNFTS